MDPLYLIAGNDRCGASLLMQMLDAADKKIVGVLPFPQTPPANEFTRQWIDRHRGCVAKMLMAHSIKYRFPKNMVKTIWLHRNPREQINSIIKVRRRQGAAVVSPRALADSLHRQEQIAKAKLHRAGRLLELRFEDFIIRPLYTAQIVAIAFKVPKEKVAGMAEVVKLRSTQCYQGFAMEKKLITEAALAAAQREEHGIEN